MEKNIVEMQTGCLSESRFDESNNLISNVCVFGSRKSLNNRIYSESAMSDITNLTGGARAYVDHPSKDDIKQRDGVRKIESWLGTFSTASRSGDKITANLAIRESFMPLMKDIVRLSPAGLGFSINARVSVNGKKDGAEVIESVKKLFSVDLVSEAATVKSLFEAIHESKKQMTDDELEEAAKQFLGQKEVDAETIQEFLKYKRR